MTLIRAVSQRLGTVVLVAILTACGGGGNSGADSPSVPPVPTRPTLAPAYRAAGNAAAGDVFVHLFEWPWSSIARECELVLAPAGYKAVQISPPQEDIAGDAWWTRYQPVSYNIDRSRSGTRAQFIDMVNRCNAVGVGIYADVVINHMTGTSGTGRNGTVFSKYSYPGLYEQADFHSPCSISSYNSAAAVQDCELLGLADLNTASPSVQAKIADYLATLMRLGVAGFRIDAVKHIQPVELDAVLTKVNQTLAAEGRSLPYVFSEVIDYGTDAVRARDYFGLGNSSGGASDITEFKFRGVGEKFLGQGGQYIAQLNPAGATGSQFSEAAWGLMPADKAVVFIENHDTQREGGLSYRDPELYRLANVWMLAQPYGYPSVMSSYGIDRASDAGRAAGPPASAPGCASDLVSAAVGTWICEHRDPLIAHMVRFRRAVAGTAIANWWDNGSNAIAFSRGTKGFVAINREALSLARTFDTGLPAGNYCDVLAGGVRNGTCQGATVAVGGDGKASVVVPSLAAIVLQAGVTL